MLKSGEKRKHLFKRGDAVVWRHWIPDHLRTGLKDRDLIEDRGIVLKVRKHRRWNFGADGKLLAGKQSVDVWKALVLFSSGEQDELPLVCLKHYGED